MLLTAVLIFDKLIKKEESSKIIDSIKMNPEALNILIASEPKLIEATIKKDPSFLLPIIKEDPKLFEFLLENKFTNMESIIQMKIDKDPNISIKALKDLNNLYESFLNYKENSNFNKKLILKEFANTNYEIAMNYNNVRNKIKDIKGRVFDSYSSKITLAEFYFIKAFELYGKINDCYYLRITKNNFCDVFKELKKLSETDEEKMKNFKKIVNSDMKKCLNLC